jgi:hypothetical protein
MRVSPGQPGTSDEEGTFLQTFIKYYINKWNPAFNGNTEELTTVLERAGDAVGNVLPVLSLDMTKIPYYLAENVYKAVCTQADFINSNGGIAGMTDTSTVGNVKIGSFSISEESVKPLPAYELCAAARGYLVKTGLLNSVAAVV